MGDICDQSISSGVIRGSHTQTLPKFEPKHRDIVKFSVTKWFAGFYLGWALGSWVLLFRKLILPSLHSLRMFFNSSRVHFLDNQRSVIRSISDVK